MNKKRFLLSIESLCLLKSFKFWNKIEILGYVQYEYCMLVRV